MKPNSINGVVEQFLSRVLFALPKLFTIRFIICLSVMKGATFIDPSHLLSQLQDILDSHPTIDEVGFVHPTQFAALNEEVLRSPSSSSGAAPLLSDEFTEQYFWHSEHKLGISTAVLVPLYNAAKYAFMDSYKRYRMLKDSSLDIIESEVIKHSRTLVLLSCDFGTAWNARKSIISTKLLLPMFLDELLLSALVLSYSPKSERAWSHRRWVIKMIAGKCPNLQEIVEKESGLVKTIAENSKMNYRAWNHRCWLVSYMSHSQVLFELHSSRDWAGLHVADNSCFHYRTRLLLQMVENVQHNNDRDVLSGAELHKIWKEELDWVQMLISRYVGREALWLHRRFLSLWWMKHLGSACDVSSFINDELRLVHCCAIIPDDEFGDYQAQATYSATYIMWLAKQMPMSFGVELQKNSNCEALKALINDVGKGWLWDTVTSSCGTVP